MPSQVVAQTESVLEDVLLVWTRQVEEGLRSLAGFAFMAEAPDTEPEPVEVFCARQLSYFALQTVAAKAVAERLAHALDRAGSILDQWGEAHGCTPAAHAVALQSLRKALQARVAEVGEVG